MGDDHSCISLQPLLMNGVHLPPGALFSVDYDAEMPEQYPSCSDFKGHIIPYRAARGFSFLRLTTLAISLKIGHVLLVHTMHNRLKTVYIVLAQHNYSNWLT